MDSKTKHRVLGVLVIIGLGVLAYPLLQSNNDMPSEQVLVKAPPFPDQASPLNQGPTPTVAPEPDAAPASATPVAEPAPAAMPDSSASSENVTPDDTMRQQPDDIITPSTSSSVVNVKAPEITSPSQQPTPDAPQKSASPDAGVAPTADAPATEEAAPAPQPSSSIEKSSVAPLQKAAKASHQAVRHVKTKTVAVAKPKLSKKALASIAKPFNMPRQDDSNGLLKLNQVAWVIQVGTFKEKGSAMHLVNQLRENGYRAFIQQLPSSSGSSTQVFVGPENRQHLARALATQLQDDMKVKGIVISYQPFSL